MYISHTASLTVGKIENGFLIEVRAPYKPKKNKDGKKTMDYEVAPGVCTKEKQVFCKDPKEVGEKISAMLPFLTDEPVAEAEFDNAFEEAAGSTMEDEE